MKIYNKEPDTSHKVEANELVYSHGYTSYNDLEAPDKVKILIKEFDKDPVKAVKSLFGVWPTKQQAQLIRSAWEVDSRVAVSSCTGAGKTTALVWLTFLFLLCKYDCRVLITSPSFQQLVRVFHSETLKWYSKMPDVWSNMFTVTREKVQLNTRKGVQIANIVTASVDNTESLQGGHSENYVILCDEASGVETEVFDVLQRTLSTGICRFILTSNPTRASGRFFDIFHSLKDKGNSVWNTMFFSAFDCPHSKPSFIEEVKNQYGEDSDFYRVGILGEFPRVSLAQFIPTDVVEKAMETDIPINEVSQYPRICGVDIARHGDDDTVFVTRQGPKILDITTYNGLDGPQVADKLLDYWRKFQHQAIYIDGHGVGASVYDSATRLPGVGTIINSLNLSLPSTRQHEYANVRAQLWGEMKNWLNRADIPMNLSFRDQLVSQTYGYNGKLAYLLTSKKDMKRAGIKSPDIADAASFSFGDKLFETRVTMVKKRNIIRKKRNLIGY